MTPGQRRILVVVSYVIDGDSLHVRPVGRGGAIGEEIELRLFAIDAPEIGQRYSARARSHLIRLARGRFLLDVLDVDHYGRTVGVLYQRSPEQSVNLLMVRDGWARYDDLYDREGYGGRRLGLERAEGLAESEGKGIWSDPGYNLAPWEYRRIQRQRAARSRRQRGRRSYSGCLLLLVGLAVFIGFILYRAVDRF